MMILDHHDDRVKLLEAATKTMFGQNPARSLVEPPFHVESHLYQTIQAADWIATIVGRLLAFRLSADFSDWKWAEDYYRQRVDRASSHSRVWQPRPQAASTQAAPGAVVITTATVTSVAAIGTGAN